MVVADANVVSAVTNASVLREQPQQLVPGHSGISEHALSNQWIVRIRHRIVEEASAWTLGALRCCLCEHAIRKRIDSATHRKIPATQSCVCHVERHSKWELVLDREVPLL